MPSDRRTATLPLATLALVGCVLVVAGVTATPGVAVGESLAATAPQHPAAVEASLDLDRSTRQLIRGARLVVSELSRLGRSLGQIVTILDALAKAGVAFVALKENIRVEGKRDIQTKVMTTLFALFAEVERDLISERTREGLTRARSSGRKLGRPKGSLDVSRLDGKEDEIRRRAFGEIGPGNVKGIEINPYAAELARVSVWIGEIQSMRRNGFGEARDPILKPPGRHRVPGRAPDAGRPRAGVAGRRCRDRSTWRILCDEKGRPDASSALVASRRPCSPLPDSARPTTAQGLRRRASRCSLAGDASDRSQSRSRASATALEELQMTTVVCWNMQWKQDSWRMLVGMGADVALLQEPSNVPPDIADHVDIGPVGDREAWRSWASDKKFPLPHFWPKIAKLSDRVDVEWFKPVLPIDPVTEDAIGVSDIQTIAAARVTPRDGESKPFIVVSMYAAWRPPHPSTGRGKKDANTDASAHRLISDLSTLVANADREPPRILAAGDLNIDYGADYGWRARGDLPLWYARCRTVWDRMEALGFEYMGPWYPNGRRAEPTPGHLPKETKNVPTHHASQTSPARARLQLDHVFASRGFHETHGDVRPERRRRMGPERPLPTGNQGGEVMLPGLRRGARTRRAGRCSPNGVGPGKAEWR